jgi:hypothetical protein
MPSFKKRFKINKNKFTKRHRKYSKRKKMIGGLKVLKDFSSEIAKTGKEKNFLVNGRACSWNSGMQRNLEHPNSIVIKCNPQSDRELDTLSTAYELPNYSFTDYDVNLKMDDNERESNVRSYTGEVVNNMLHGDGKLILKSECTFDGAFDNDALVSGVVTYTPPRPAVYGELVVEPTKIHTEVIFDGKPVKKYTGPIRNGTPNGDGVVYFNDGTMYQGPIVDGNIPLQEPQMQKLKRLNREPAPPSMSSAELKVRHWNPDNLKPKLVHSYSPPKTELERVQEQIDNLEKGTISRTQDDTELFQLYRRRNALISSMRNGSGGSRKRRGCRVKKY